MIYFDAETQARAAEKLAASLEPGGYLFIGQAESLPRKSPSLEYVQPAVYRKAAQHGGVWNRS
jgi:chemotaxis protein methyltransferase CheR